MIKELQRNATLRNPSMGGGTSGQCTGRSHAGGSGKPQCRPVMALQMNLANQSGGMNAGELFQMAAQQQPQTQAPTRTGWTCNCGAAENTGKFCTECGAKKPEENVWIAHAAAIIRGVSVRSAANPSRQCAGSIAVINAAGSRKTPQSLLASVRNVGIRSGTRTKSKSRAGF